MYYFYNDVVMGGTKGGKRFMEEKTKLQIMLEKKEHIMQGGGEKKVAKQHEKGKLTARERIALLFDEGTFQECFIKMLYS